MSRAIVIAATALLAMICAVVMESRDVGAEPLPTKIRFFNKTKRVVIINRQGSAVANLKDDTQTEDVFGDNENSISCPGNTLTIEPLGTSGCQGVANIVQPVYVGHPTGAPNVAVDGTYRTISFTIRAYVGAQIAEMDLCLPDPDQGDIKWDEVALDIDEDEAAGTVTFTATTKYLLNGEWFDLVATTCIQVP